MTKNKFSILKVFFAFAILALVFVYFYTNNPTSGDAKFIRCPSNFLLGINCPGCGTQRALHHLLHFEIVDALRYNAFFVLAIPVIMLYFLNWIRNELFNQNKQIKFLQNKKVLIALLIILIVFGIFRNINLYPFTLLSPNL